MGIARLCLSAEIGGLTACVCRFEAAQERKGEDAGTGNMLEAVSGREGISGATVRTRPPMARSG